MTASRMAAAYMDANHELRRQQRFGCAARCAAIFRALLAASREEDRR